MGTKSIVIRDEVYERLKDHKRENESFTDLIDRLLDETTVDWCEGFGTLDTDEAEELERIVKKSREQTSEGLAKRQQKALEELSSTESTNETT